MTSANENHAVSKDERVRGLERMLDWGVPRDPAMISVSPPRICRRPGLPSVYGEMIDG